MLLARRPGAGKGIPESVVGFYVTERPLFARGTVSLLTPQRRLTMKDLKRFAVLAAVLLLAALPAFAQSWAGHGRLQGIVTDSQGKPVEGAKISLLQGEG